MALADSVPGVSGGTIAFLLGFYDQFIAPTFKSFVSGCFKKVCQEFLEKESAKGNLPEVFANKGQWVGKKGSIDFIFQDEEEEILAGICNWEKEMMLYEEAEYVHKVLKEEEK